MQIKNDCMRCHAPIRWGDGRRLEKNGSTRIGGALRLGAMVLTFAAWCALACFFVAAPDANAQRISQEYIGTSKPFNPASCKAGNKKYVYWAAKDQVFRFKFDPKEPLYPRGWWVNDARLSSNRQKEVPPAPMPSEPEGCYGNPLRAGIVPYMQAMAEDELFKLFGRQPKIERSHSGFSAQGKTNESTRLFESSHKNQLIGKDCWLRSPGVWECLVSKGTDRSDYSINRKLKIVDVLPPEKAGTRDLYISILYDAAAMVNRANGVLAESEIGLFDNVMLATLVRIFPNEIDKLKPYHLRLVRYVLDAHVPGYQWTNTQPQLNKKAGAH